MQDTNSSGKSLLDRLTDTRWPVPPSPKDKIYLLPGRPLVLKKPTFSYKSKKVTVTLQLAGFPLTYSIPIKKLDRIIDKVLKLTDGTGLMQALLDGLLWAGQLYAPQSRTIGKPRGRQAKSKAFISKLKYAAAWTYKFVKQEWQKPSTDRYVPLQRAQKKLKEERDDQECHDDVEMTAFLVFHAYKSERGRYRIENPWGKIYFSRENFLRRYLVQPITGRIGKQIQRKPMLLTPLPVGSVVYQREDEAENAWIKACQSGRFRNPILREIFQPWSSN